MISIGIILPAAGSGIRFGGHLPKQYMLLGNKPVILYAVEISLSIDGVQSVVIPVSPTDTTLQALLKHNNIDDDRINIVTGGNTRRDSVANALMSSSIADVDVILVHDAVRPLASKRLFEQIINAAYREGAAIPCVEESDTTKIVSNDFVVDTINRSEIRRVQTPQGFRREVLVNAYNNAVRHSLTGTDDASLVEAAGHPVRCIPGEHANIKITTNSDLIYVESLLSK
ncbi:MAG: 2-C-methyl-D-erythritol 4-phosphate cytidylyltransferase [Ignavibacteria bacterium]|nr:2-C-methyl-D-erythritol 4-phosphate cytidylyltransferase [Ignavibacteria bacterium]